MWGHQGRYKINNKERYFMGMHRYLRMRKVLQATISSADFISIPTNHKFEKAVRYIHDNNSWERFYLLLNIMFPCIRVICLAYINRVGIDTVLTIRELTSSALRKKFLILIIRNYSQTYFHQPTYGTSQMTKLTKKSQYQTIILSIQT